MKMQNMTRRKVLQQFTRNLGGQIITGHPDHPDEEGRFLWLDKGIAAQLADQGLVEDRHSDEEMPEFDDVPESQRAHADSLIGLVAEGEGKGIGGGDTGAVEGNTGGTNAGAHNNSAQAAREHRAAGKPVAADTKRRGQQQRGGRTPRTKGPAGGDMTNATTSHPIESGPSTPPAEIPGNTSEADPDAAPTGGAG